MKTVLGCIRKADTDFEMIAPGDRIAVGVSGGKDSLLLLYALSLYRKFSGKDFTLQAITLKMGLEPFDVEPIRALCEQIDVPYTVLDTEIAHIIFDVRKESNPCALCAKMRRGALNDAALAAGCTKVALGHHRDDAIETLLMSLIFEGRLHTFHPNTYLSRKGVTVIRPMVYVPEKHVIHVVKTLNLPVIHNPCPADGNSKREEIKELIKTLSKTYPQLKDYMLSALRNTEQYGLWDEKQAGRKLDTNLR
ncbi:MAG: tRNA 2-thiocytidine biosynthesis TtcA family protein [Clostridiales bacterium]|nr:tRNA 2-thiocytidine biosynthesis TtcA family protein [Clostridiales bacterium]